MRGAVDGLRSSQPLAHGLPALYRDPGGDTDDSGSVSIEAFLAPFDAALAPILSTLDNLESYLDPTVAPSDFVAWLGRWVGVVADEDWSVERQRALVAAAPEVYRWRGTVAGLAGEVAMYTGVEPEIVDSGGTSWSSSPDGPPPGSGDPAVTVRLRVADPSTVDRRRLDALVAAAKPAHLRHRVEVLPA